MFCDILFSWCRRQTYHFVPVFINFVAISSCVLYFSFHSVWWYCTLFLFAYCRIFALFVTYRWFGGHFCVFYRSRYEIVTNFVRFVQPLWYFVLCYVVRDHYVCFVQPLWYFIFLLWSLWLLCCVCRSLYNIVLWCFVFGFADFEFITSYQARCIIGRCIVCKCSVLSITCVLRYHWGSFVVLFCVFYR